MSRAALHVTEPAVPASVGLAPSRSDEDVDSLVSGIVPESIPAPSPELSVVLPARDERENLAPLIDEIAAALEGLHAYEVIVVDDGSIDGTLEELRRLRRERHPGLRIVAHAQGAGQSRALLSGVRAARAPLVVTLDADGQNVPDDIAPLVALARDYGPDEHFCIVGHRRARHDTRWRRLQSRVANACRRAVLRDGTPDTGCALKVMPRETWLALPAFDHMHRFLPALVRQLGGSVRVHAVRHRERRHGRSKYAMAERALAGLVDLLGVLWLGRRTRAVSAHEIVEPDERG